VWVVAGRVRNVDAKDKALICGKSASTRQDLLMSASTYENTITTPSKASRSIRGAWGGR